MGLQLFLFQKKLQQEIIEFLFSKKKLLSKGGVFVSEQILDLILQRVSLGKQFRGLLALNAYQKIKQCTNQEIITSRAIWQLAVVLEVVGFSILVQDDIIDRSEMRRGKQSLHRAIAELGDLIIAKKEEKEHFALGSSLCIVDSLLYWSTELLANLEDISAEIKNKLIILTSREIASLAIAELEESFLTSLPIDDSRVTEEVILTIYQQKTARYTISWPLQSVAMLLNLDSSIIAQIDELSSDLGILFQLVDDKLGLFGDPIVTGKSNLDDFKEAKKTLYIFYLLQKLTKEDLQIFQSLFGKQDLSMREGKQLVSLIKKYQIDVKIDTLIRQYADRSYRHIDLFNYYPFWQSSMREIVKFLVNRKK